MAANNKPIRHGEVLLFPVTKVPSSKGKTKKYMDFIVGHSETGHHHVLESKHQYAVTVLGDDSVFVQLAKPAKLSHKKTVNRHHDLVVDPGTYQVIRKREYDPFGKAMREVWD